MFEREFLSNLTNLYFFFKESLKTWRHTSFLFVQQSLRWNLARSIRIIVTHDYLFRNHIYLENGNKLRKALYPDKFEWLNQNLNWKYYYLVPENNSTLSNRYAFIVDPIRNKHTYILFLDSVGLAKNIWLYLLSVYLILWILGCKYFIANQRISDPYSD